jgi:uncharacterized protein YukE
MKDSERLRRAASKLRTIAGRLDDKPLQVKRDFPYQKYWKGPAADTFNEGLEKGLKELRALAGDIDDYARRLEEKAAALDREEKEGGRKTG